MIGNKANLIGNKATLIGNKAKFIGNKRKPKAKQKQNDREQGKIDREQEETKSKTTKKENLGIQESDSGDFPGAARASQDQQLVIVKVRTPRSASYSGWGINRSDRIERSE